MGTREGDSRKRTTAIESVRYDQLLAEDLRRASLKAKFEPSGIVTLGDSCSMPQGPIKLGPILSRRFSRF